MRAHVTEGRDPDPLAGCLVAVSAVCVAASVVVFIVVSAAGPSAAVITMPKPAVGPPWWLSLHPAAVKLTFLLWGTAVVGAGGVIAGLAAIARGARPPVRPILIFSFLSVVILSVLPAAGSTDILDYAANGRMVVTGHSPYVETPLQLKNAGDPIGRWVPVDWETDVSVYGPVATAEEWAAAELGGTSLARITFWLKLWGAIAFGAVALMIDRLLRSDPGRRLRGHLLWTVNPLLLWEIVASGHVDGLSAAFGLLGIIVLRSGRAGERPSLYRFALAGLFIGAAAAIKVPYALFTVGVAWAGRRQVSALAAATAGFAVIFAPGYVIAGRPAFAALFNRGPTATWDTMYQYFYHRLSYTDAAGAVTLPHLTEIASVVFAAVAVARAAALPRPHPRTPGPKPRAGGQPGLPAHRAVRVPLVRRHGHLPAGDLPGIPAGLARHYPARPDCPRLPARNTHPRPCRVCPYPQRRRNRRRRGRRAGRGAGLRLAVRVRVLGLARAERGNRRPARCRTSRLG